MNGQWLTTGISFGDEFRAIRNVLSVQFHCPSVQVGSMADTKVMTHGPHYFREYKILRISAVHQKLLVLSVTNISNSVRSWLLLSRPLCALTSWKQSIKFMTQLLQNNCLVWIIQYYTNITNLIIPKRKTFQVQKLKL